MMEGATGEDNTKPASNNEIDLKQETDQLIRWKAKSELSIEEMDNKLKLYEDIISEQTTETQELEASNLKLIADLETMDGESDELEQTLVCVRREVEALTVQIQHLQGQAMQSRDEDHLLHTKRKEMEAQLQDLYNELAFLSAMHREEVMDIKEKIQIQEEDNSRIAQQQENELAQLNSGLDASKERLAASERQLEEARQRRNEQEGILVEKTELLHSKEKELQMKKEESAELLDKLTQENCQLEERAQTMRAHVKSQLERRDELRACLATRTNENNNIRKRTAEVVSTTAELARIQGKEAAQIREIERDSLSLKKDLEEVKEWNRMARSKLVDFDSLKAEYKKKYDDLLSSEERNKEIKDKITSLGPVRREKFKLDSRILDLEKEIYEKNETYREEITALEAANRKTKLDLEFQKSEESEQISSMKEEMIVYDTKLTKSSDELTRLEMEAQAADERCCKLRDEKRQLEDQLAASQIELANQLDMESDLKTQLEKMIIECGVDAEVIKSEMSKPEETIRNLKQEIEVKTKETTAVGNNIKDMTKMMEEAMKKKEQLCVEKITREEKTQLLVAELEAKATITEELKDQVEQMTCQLEQRRSKSESLRAEDERLSQILLSERSDIEKATKTKADLQVRLDSLLVKCDVEEEQVKALMEDLAEKKSQSEMTYQQIEQSLKMNKEKLKESVVEKTVEIEKERAKAKEIAEQTSEIVEETTKMKEQSSAMEEEIKQLELKVEELEQKKEKEEAEEKEEDEEDEEMSDENNEAIISPNRFFRRIPRVLSTPSNSGRLNEPSGRSESVGAKSNQLTSGAGEGTSVSLKSTPANAGVGRTWPSKMSDPSNLQRSNVVYAPKLRPKPRGFSYKEDSSDENETNAKGSVDYKSPPPRTPSMLVSPPPRNVESTKKGTQFNVELTSSDEEN